MNAKTLLLLPAAFALAIPADAYSSFRFGLNLALPLPLYYSAPVYARTPAYQGPTAPAEQVTVAPGPGYVWMSGHWSSVNHAWVWVGGHWEMPPSPSALWVGGHWVRGASGWIWVDGAWSAGTPPAPPQTPATAPNARSPLCAAHRGLRAVHACARGRYDRGADVPYDPPAPVVEYVPPYPYPDAVWIGGYWGWRGSWVLERRPFWPAPVSGSRLGFGGMGARGPWLGLARRTVALGDSRKAAVFRLV